jgi:hypothetical protein
MRQTQVCHVWLILNLNWPVVNHTFPLERQASTFFGRPWGDHQMAFYNWEDWVFGLSFIAVGVFAASQHHASGPSIATDAIASEGQAVATSTGLAVAPTAVSAPATAQLSAPPSDTYIKVTAKRLPAECKGEAPKPSHCAALLEADTETVIENR